MRLDASGNLIIASTGGTLQTATAGTSNFRAGVNAGNSIASGSFYNVLIGDEAGTAITTGDENTAIGFEALTTEDTGGRNTAVGYEALTTQNYDGYGYNVAMGYSAGSAVTTGINNTFIGALAGDGTDDSNGNTAVGYLALSANCGSENTAVGKQAGTDITGTLNTVMGVAAGVNITSGGGNTVIGHDAGRQGTDLATGNNNTLVGRETGVSAEDGEGQNVFGKGVVGNQDNSFTFGIGTSDSLILAGATSISAPSDERYKEEITTSTAGLSFINDLRPVTFKWKKKKKTFHQIIALLWKGLKQGLCVVTVKLIMVL